MAPYLRRYRRSTERTGHSHAAWWRVAFNVSRSAAVAVAIVTPTEGASTRAHFRNGSPIAARLARNDPGALFQKCRVNPRRCFADGGGVGPEETHDLLPT